MSYWLMTISRYRTALLVGTMLLLSIMLVPATFAVDDAFGLSYGSASGLGTNDLRTTAASIINVALSLLGIVALVIILVGGFEWMTAGGEEEKTAEARKRIFAGVIGLAIILSAFAIARFVFQKLGEATDFQGTRVQ